MAVTLDLDLLPGAYAVARLDTRSPLPPWAGDPVLSAHVRSGDELTVLCPQDNVPADVRSAGGWRALRVRGPLDFALTGILLSLLDPLARNGVPVFTLSSFDTDIVLVPGADLERALGALRGAGHRVDRGTEGR